MKLTKKLLAILLTVASLISVFAMAAGAAGVVYYGAATVNVSQRPFHLSLPSRHAF